MQKRDPSHALEKVFPEVQLSSPTDPVTDGLEEKDKEQIDIEAQLWHPQPQ